MTVNSTDRIGKTIAGKYVIHGVLGSGGQAVLYRATDSRLEHRIVAAKLIEESPWLDGGRFLKKSNPFAGYAPPHIIAL